MDQLSQSFGGMNATIIMWIAAGVAALFVFIVLFDFFRQRRKYSRITSRRPRIDSAKTKADLPLKL